MDTQYIYNNQQIEFVVIPYRDYLRLTRHQDAVAAENQDADCETLIPQAVMELRFLKGLSKLAAWRKHLKISQKELARRAGMTQGALSQMEKSGAKPQRASLEKLAAAMGLDCGCLSSDN